MNKPITTGIVDGENILPDDYPVYPGYYYVGDEVVIESPIKGDVAQLKRTLNCKEIRNCKLIDRNIRPW